MEGYCISCRMLKEMVNVLLKKLKSGVEVYEGKCVACNNIIIKKKD